MNCAAEPSWLLMVTKTHFRHQLERWEKERGVKHNLTFDLFKKAFLGNEPHFTWGSALTLQQRTSLRHCWEQHHSWAGRGASVLRHPGLRISKIEERPVLKTDKMKLPQKDKQCPRPDRPNHDEGEKEQRRSRNPTALETVTND